MIRLLFTALVGAFLVTAITLILTQEDEWFGVLIGLFVAGMMLMPLSIIRDLLRPATGPVSLSPEQFAEADAAGRVALARVVEVRQTGAELNNQPLCEFDLMVVPQQGAPFVATIRRVVPLLELAQVGEGEIMVVVRNAKNPQRVRPVKNPTSEWERRAESDPQVRRAEAPAPPEKPAGRLRGAWLWGALLVGAVVVGVPASAAVAARAEAGTLIIPSLTDPLGLAAAERLKEKQAEERQIVGAERGNEARDAFLSALPEPRAMEVTIFRDRVDVVAPTAPGAATFDQWEFSDGAVTREGAARSQPRAEEAQLALFDLRELDLSSLGDKIARAEELTGVTYRGNPISVKRDLLPTKPDPETPVTMRILLSDDYFSAQVLFGLDGSVVYARSDNPNSSAYQP